MPSLRFERILWNDLGKWKKMATTLGTEGLRMLVDGRRANFYGLFHHAVNIWIM
jgi:hypothetical protein